MKGAGNLAAHVKILNLTAIQKSLTKKIPKKEI
jgi:hypothetical protein